MLTFVVLIIIFLPIEVPAVLFLGVWFLFQLWQGGFDIFAPTGTGTGVAFFAHQGLRLRPSRGPVLAPEKASRPGVAAREL